MKNNVNVSVKAAALKKDGYFFDHSINTLYVTKTFSKKASDPMGSECAMILRLRAIFPELVIEIAEAAKTKSAALTYDLMMKYIARTPNALESLKELERVRLMSKCQKSPYKFVRTWFEEKFPNYDKMLQFDENGEVIWNTKSEDNVIEMPKAANQ